MGWASLSCLCAGILEPAVHLASLFCAGVLPRLLSGFPVKGGCVPGSSQEAAFTALERFSRISVGPQLLQFLRIAACLDYVCFNLRARPTALGACGQGELKDARTTAFLLPAGNGGAHPAQSDRPLFL